MKKDKDNPKLSLKDLIIFVVFAIIGIVNIITDIVINGFNGIGALIEQTILILLSFVGFIEIAYYCHWLILVPDFMIQAHEKERNTETEIYMKKFFTDDINFVRNYNKERINYILTQMGITESQLDEIRLILIKMRCLPLRDLDDAKRKLKYYLRNKQPLIINQQKVNSADLAYSKVQYYINITDAMFLPEYAKEFSSILAWLIGEKANIKEIKRIIVPEDGNFLLGVEVSKRLGIPLVKMRSERGKVLISQPWEGQLNPSDKVIIVHDVLVTAEQIIRTLSKLPETCDVLGVYCLFTRKEWGGVDVLSNEGISVEQVICVDDEDIQNIRKDQSV